MSDSPAVPGIHAAMLAIEQALPRIEKNGTLSFGSSKVKTLVIDDILAALKPLLIKNNVVVYPSVKNHESYFDLGGNQEVLGSGVVITSPKVPVIRVREWVVYDFLFVYTLDGTGITISVSAEAMDSQDKSSRKAATSAQKTAYILAFNIETGEPDPDTNEVTEAPAEKKTSGQQKVDAARDKPAAKAATPPPVESEKPSITTDPRPKAEPAESPAATVDQLDALKGRVRDAVGALGGSAVFTKIMVDETAATALGKPNAQRAEWINSTVALKKVVAALEAKVAALPAEDGI